MLSSCTSFAPTFKEGQEHLRKTYGLTVDALPAPNRTSAENGKDIAQFIKSSYGKDGRKFILIAYSKGAPDALEGLAADPQAAQAVAALITVAGAIGGSPIADIMPAQVEHWLSSLGEHGCQGDLAGALKSLRRKVRREFLERHPHPGFPVYSIVAVSDRTNTSKLLLEPWILLSFFGSREDSLIESDDAVFPGGILLGAARADHWAVALPFEDLSDPHIKSLVNHNHYPRTALLESLVRYVTADLAAADSSRVSRLPSR